MTRQPAEPIEPIEDGEPAEPVRAGTALALLLADLAEDAAAAAPVAPPAGLRSAVLGAIRSNAAAAPWSEPAQLPAPACPLAAQARLLDDLLASLSPHQWAEPVVNGWTVAQVVGHLLAVDAICAQALGLPVPAGAAAGEDVESRTAAVHRWLAEDPPRVHSAWRGQVVAILRHANARGGPGLAAPVRYLGLDLSAGDVLLDRAFETWIHLEDLRAMLDRDRVPPPAADAHRLADLGLRLMPITWPGGVASLAGPFLVSLTGPGGGTWSIRPDGVVRNEAAGGQEGARAGARVSLDVVDFCRLAGGRLDPAGVPHTAEGDQSAAAAALEAAAALARL